MPAPFVSFFLETYWYPIVFMYGAIVGSFLGVVIYRLPLILLQKWEIENAEDEQVRKRQPSLSLNGKSFCDRCGAYLKPWQNVPIFGFLFLGGRCASCRQRISWRHFMVEVLTACLFTAIYHAVHPMNLVEWTNFLFQALFVATLVALIFIDLDHFIAPDELNLTAAIFGVGRDLACLGIAFLVAQTQHMPVYFHDMAPKFLAVGWIPWAILGALTYSGVLLLVSLAGFLYYARPPWEPIGAATKRYFIIHFTDTEMEEPAPPAGYKDAEAEIAAEADSDPADTEGIEAAEEEEGEAPRLHFSPGLLAVIAALLMIPATGWFAILFFLVPFVGFLIISRAPGDTFGTILKRFFSVDDQAGLPDDALPVEKVAEDPNQRRVEQMQEEADQFAREAESGKHGGMGVGDVKLAFGIGAILGPGMALLSLFFATLLGAVTGILVAQRYGRSLRTGVPFVPFMAAGAIITMLFGQSLVHWYLQITGMEQPPPKVEAPIVPRRLRRNAVPVTPNPAGSDPVRPYVSR